LAGSAGEWIDAASKPFRVAGIGYGALKAADGRLWPEGQARVPWADGRFATPSGRFVFPDRFVDEPVLPTADFPLHLIAQATADAMNSQILEADQDGLITAEVSSIAASLAGVADGDRAALHAGASKSGWRSIPPCARTSWSSPRAVGTSTAAT
jgi:hypothetical protein